jgi:hypothetical protein
MLNRGICGKIQFLKFQIKDFMLNKKAPNQGA